MFELLDTTTTEQTVEDLESNCDDNDLENLFGNDVLFDSQESIETLLFSSGVETISD